MSLERPDMAIDQKIIELAKKRGIEDEKLDEFFSSKPKETYDPFLLPDMEAGVDLILSSIDEGKKICIYGDYDCDGVTATVIMTELLEKLAEREQIIRYIPSRFDEGYGLNMHAIDVIKGAGAELIVTVDCGSVSCEEVEYAKELGMDVLVTDHHRIEDKQADTLLINPARKDSEYPCPYLAGCGVAFKVAQAISAEVGLESELTTSLLDLVALGTIGDIVPLLGENRTLVKYGMRVINSGRREALEVLKEKTGIGARNVTSENVSFILVPHINSAGRVSSATLALKLFLAKTREDMEKYADDLVASNRERKRLQDGVYEKALSGLDRDAERDIIFTYVSDAHEGVAGIAAGKLKEKFYVPSLILTDTDDGLLKGTGRSIDGLDLYDLLKKEERYFLRFGGHAMACGFTMEKDRFDAVKDDLSSAAHEIRENSPDVFVEKHEPELEMGIGDATIEFVNSLSLMEPFGRKNERPKIGIRGSLSSVREMGKDGRYLRFRLEKEGEGSVGCVAFSKADKVRKIVFDAEKNGDEVMVTGKLSLNEWNGNTDVQMEVLHVERLG